MIDRHIRYLKFARSISLLSDFQPHKIGCILVYKKQIVSVGYNTNKSHPLQKEYNAYRNLQGTNINHKAHAEILCIHRASKLNIDFKNCVLYIFREHKDKTWAIAKPCPACMAYIENMGIGTVIYSFGNREYGVIKT